MALPPDGYGPDAYETPSDVTTTGAPRTTRHGMLGRTPYGTPGAFGTAARPVSGAARVCTIISFVCAVVAIFFAPVLFGVIGIALGIIGGVMGDRLGYTAAVASLVGAVIGLVLAYAVFHAATHAHTR